VQGQINHTIFISGPYCISLIELFKRTTNSFHRGQRVDKFRIFVIPACKSCRSCGTVY